MRLIIWPDPLICSAGQEDISPALESLPGTRRDTASSQPTRRRSAGGRVPPILENCRILSSWPWSSCLSLSPWGWSAVDWRSGLDTEQHTPSKTQWQWLSLENILGKTTLNKLELTNTRPRRENIIEILCRTTNENKTRFSQAHKIKYNFVLALAWWGRGQLIFLFILSKQKKLYNKL